MPESFHYPVPESCQIKNLQNIYLDYFGYKQDGYFIDVGAYDGITYSNTWGLAEVGWNGICYEPVSLHYAQCVSNHAIHAGVKSIQTCIGKTEGEIDLIVADVYSTYKKSMTKIREQFYRSSSVTSSTITTLNKSLKENNVKPGFELFSVDVEGAEMDVLEGFDLSYWHPKMCIVEAHEKHPNPEMRVYAPYINRYFSNRGYHKIYSDDTNNIYVERVA